MGIGRRPREKLRGEKNAARQRRAARTAMELIQPATKAMEALEIFQLKQRGAEAELAASLRRLQSIRAQPRAKELVSGATRHQMDVLRERMGELGQILAHCKTINRYCNACKIAGIGTGFSPNQEALAFSIAAISASVARQATTIEKSLAEISRLSQHQQRHGN